ncbi:hypothetical protein [Leptolyngbya iicbica]|uniref:Uncharacterized protein n=2 Tax=Cyanophyceae TaxID=3028117 RepID=A0A4Q7E3B9_9CYAN|nr:hypothetical protein [Leptolyngbya sp. LK]RZM76502.1 hypothetical protein DYY88_17680 [Leptolyngbya sp. LK]
MKLNRFLVSILSGLLILSAAFGALSPVHASSIAPMSTTLGFSLFGHSSSVNETQSLKQLKSDVIPQLVEILTPLQQEMFEANMLEGESFRKTFRSLMLTPEQKREIKSVINTIPQRDAFSTLSAMEKKELFLKKKEVFMPSSEEIIDKIESKIPEGASVPEAVKDKIKTGVEMRDKFMPSSEEIMDKIKAGMEQAEAEMENITGSDD